jgi:formylglycine-generating enzyme required for sulfatase activity
VFISYSHADRDWVERLKRMMAPLLRGSGQELRLWDDSQIEAGRKWREAIETALAQAKVALLLVSDHFLASEFVMGEEVPKLLAAAEAEGVRVLWVSLTACLVEETEIHQYQAVLPPGRPLDQMAEAEVKEALKTIGLEIRKALKPQQEAVALPSFVEKSASPARQESSGQAPQSNRASGASQAFSVTTAQLVRVGAGWQEERRSYEVRGRTLELGDGVSLPLIAIPAGEFVMGSPLFDEPERQDNEGPQHRVQLEGFLMGQMPITQAQWRAVARLVPPLGQRWERELPLNPSQFSGQPDSDQRPVEKVSWLQAIEFCRRLSAFTGDLYTLPSEAQWEYACRAGTSTPFAFGETISPGLANYDANYTYANSPKGEYRQQTTPVGSFPANAWGLQDMHGNVWEWCLDHWHGNAEGAPIDGSAWLSTRADAGDMSRLLRGGSWFSLPRFCRSAFRDLNRPVDAYDFVGFRVVCLPQGPSLNP